MSGSLVGKPVGEGVLNAEKEGRTANAYQGWSAMKAIWRDLGLLGCIENSLLHLLLAN